MAFSVSYDPVSHEVDFTCDGTTLLYTTAFTDFGDMFIRARATQDGSTMWVDGLVLDGTPLGDASFADPAVGGLDILYVRGADLQAGFTLTGEATMTWSGPAPNNSHLAFQIKTARLGAVTADSAPWGDVKTMFR